MREIPFPGAGEKLFVCGLGGCAGALALAGLATGRRVLAVARNASAAVRLAEHLACFMDPGAVWLVPGWETLPYDDTSPPRSAVCERSAVLARLRAGVPGVYVVGAADATLPCIPPENAAQLCLSIAVGDTVDVRGIVRDLDAAGCARVERVRAPGEYAAYSGQLDFFSAGVGRPCRLVLDDLCVEQIRLFDPATQMSTGTTDRLEIMPAREYPLDRVSVARFRLRWRELIPPDSDDRIYDLVSRGGAAEGAEFLLPLFHDRCASIFDYLSGDEAVWLCAGVDDALQRHASLVRERYAEVLGARRAALPPDMLFLSPEKFRAACGRYPLVGESMDDDDDPAAFDAGAAALPPLCSPGGRVVSRARLSAWLDSLAGMRVVFAAGDKAGCDRMLAQLGATGRDAAGITRLDEVGKPGYYLLRAPLCGGFVDEGGTLAVVTERELLGYSVPPRRARGCVVAASFDELLELSAGELVVHEMHGVGRFQGLLTRLVDGREQDFLTIEYSGGARLHVSVAHVHLVSRYRKLAPGEEVSLDKLGGRRWGRTMAKAATAARDTAAHLLEIYAQRERSVGRPVSLNGARYAHFCAGFAHAETPDQTRVSAEVVSDLCASRPMDRLVCGDVGFGKTEVAMRAAWVSWAAGQQVAVLTPTSILCEQHYRSFCARFEGTGARLLELSSSLSGRGRRAALAGLASGAALIAIGTHSLLGSQVSMPGLGLAIIDEEHRFGVRQKERIRSLRSSVNVMTISATPIPRTLSMAMEGLRDMSLMSHPPPSRLAVRTFVANDGDRLVREALARELARGGQTFYLHNRVQTMSVALERVRDLAPEARIACAHGRMPRAQLEDVMLRFYRGEIDVLVSSVIVQSGLDVPNANTIVVTRAGNLGLAELHQLRGRVGRSHRQGYAYFLTDMKNAGSDAEARLATIAESAKLGGGYHISIRDLEIRGSGELLGEAQSGAVENVGIDNFRNLVARAAKRIKGEPDLDLARIDLGGSALLPAEYCPSPLERLRLYHRFAAARGVAEVELLRELLADRFGALPMGARLLVASHLLRLRASGAGIARVVPVADGLKIYFAGGPADHSSLPVAFTARRDCVFAADGALHIVCQAMPEDRARTAASLLDAIETGPLPVARCAGMT